VTGGKASKNYNKSNVEKASLMIIQYQECWKLQSKEWNQG